MKLFQIKFTRLPIPLTCLNGLSYILNFNMSLVFYKPPANIYHAESRKQCYHVTNFDMVKLNMYGKLTWHVKGVGSLVNCVVPEYLKEICHVLIF